MRAVTPGRGGAQAGPLTACGEAIGVIRGADRSLVCVLDVGLEVRDAEVTGSGIVGPLDEVHRSVDVGPGHLDLGHVAGGRGGAHAAAHRLVCAREACVRVFSHGVRDEERPGLLTLLTLQVHMMACLSRGGRGERKKDVRMDTKDARGEPTEGRDGIEVAGSAANPGVGHGGGPGSRRALLDEMAGLRLGHSLARGAGLRGLELRVDREALCEV